jgi:hypothetical protein
MRSIVEVNKKVYDVSELKVGKWYISYNSHDNKRLLFKYRGFNWMILNTFIMCYCFNKHIIVI